MPQLDIFSRGGTQYAGSFAADAAKIVISADELNEGGVGLLTQNLSAQYAQQVARIYELGTQNTYLVIGRAQGSASLQRVLGPRPIQLGFYKKFGDGCNVSTNNIDLVLDAGCTQSGGQPVNFSEGTFAFTLRNCLITSIGITVAAQDMVVNEALQLMYISLHAR